MGPFVTAQLAANTTDGNDIIADELFSGIVMSKVDSCLKRLHREGVDVKCYILPHVDDAVGDFVVPQPPIDLSNAGDLGYARAYSNVEFVGNPAVISVGTSNPVKIGLTSLSVISDISSECIVLGPTCDRIGEICGTLLKQRSFYPLFPPRKDIPLDSCRWRGLQIDDDCSPLDLLIVPSLLKLFAKKLNNQTVCINPGNVCKFNRTGTYAEIVLDLKNQVDRVCRVTIAHV
mmetsp:Transcript_3918/g.11723  ORF Transcript_3918/g.11723 Transcript_3918/m.11723 type:complete len:232 (-) Transcript_3918:156-851(-)